MSDAGRGPAVDDESFVAAIEAHRRDVVLLCYRFLGSLTEAEDAAQETALRAWQARASFRGDAGLRTWLHRIATRVSIDLLRGRRRRIQPESLGPAADPSVVPLPADPSVPWVEPLPLDVAAVAGPDPAAQYDLRESVSLAFIAALQLLPPRQRTVLLLRDVLAWSARETADTLDMSVPAVNSALHRARVALETSRTRTGREAIPIAAPQDPVVRRLFDAYLRAWAADDVATLVATMREDVRLAMPPSPSWYDGRAAVEALLTRWVFGAMRPPGGYRVEPIHANGWPGFIFGAVDGPDVGVLAVEVATDGIAAVTVFLDPSIARRFAPSSADAPRTATRPTT